MSKVLIIGDSCKDVFIYGEIDRLTKSKNSIRAAFLSASFIM